MARPFVDHMETAATEEVKVARVGRARRDGKRTILEMHHLVATADGVDHLVDHHELTLFERVEYEEPFRAAGLAVDIVPSPMPDARSRPRRRGRLLTKR